jgi:hypothetical protein
MNIAAMLKPMVRSLRSRTTSPAVAALLLASGAWLLGPAGAAAQCEPTSCEAEGKDCGTLDDGCGGTLECGGCDGDLVCGGGGIANVCAAGAPEEEEPAEPGELEVPTPPALPEAPRSPDELAARGRELAEADPLLAQLRDELGNQLGERWGFEVGLGASEGHTEHGPGKEQLAQLLMPGQRAGYRIAVGFTIDRHRHAERIAIGEAIAQADAVTARLRNGPQGGIYYRLGFDVASAIFGPRVLGAQGNTQTGPGSLAIRDSLGSREAQMGFAHSMSLHLSRKYPQ